MADDKPEHLIKLPIDSISESVNVEPQVGCSEAEVLEVLQDLSLAVDSKTYVPQTPTEDNPALSDDYIFDTEDENFILKDLTWENFVGKVKDLGKGAKK